MKSNYAFLLMMYRLRRIGAADVWAAADRGEITPDEAAAICGPRPK